MISLKPAHKAALAVALIGGGLFAVYEADHASHGVNALDAIPSQSFIALTADADALRLSPLFEAILGKDGRSVGLGAVTEACGFDPTTRVHALAVAVPEEGEQGDFGIAAQLDATPEEIRGCAEKLAKSHGDHAQVANAGGFYVLEPDDPSKPRLAYKPSGGAAGTLIVARGTWLDAMMDAATAQKPGISSSAAHKELRDTLARTVPAPSIVVTAVLPRSVRERVKRQMDLDAESDPRAKEIMEGVLGVSTIGVAIAAGHANAGKAGSGDAAIHVEMRCESDHACGEIEKLLLRKRLELSQKLSVRLLAGPLLDSFQAHADGARLSASASAPADDLARGVSQLLGFRRDDAPSRRATAPFQTSFPLGTARTPSPPPYTSVISREPSASPNPAPHASATPP